MSQYLDSVSIPMEDGTVRKINVLTPGEAYVIAGRSVKATVKDLEASVDDSKNRLLASQDVQHQQHQRLGYIRNVLGVGTVTEAVLTNMAQKYVDGLDNNNVCEMFAGRTVTGDEGVHPDWDDLVIMNYTGSPDDEQTVFLKGRPLASNCNIVTSTGALKLREETLMPASEKLNIAELPELLELDNETSGIVSIASDSEAEIDSIGGEKITGIDVRCVKTSVTFSAGAVSDHTSLEFFASNGFECSSYKNFFKGCSSLVLVTGLDKIDMGGVTDVSRFFEGCKSLCDDTVRDAVRMVQVGDSLTTCSGIFKGCDSITYLDLSPWADIADGVSCNFSSVADKCQNLHTVDISGFGYIHSKIDQLIWGIPNLRTLIAPDLRFNKSYKIMSFIKDIKDSVREMYLGGIGTDEPDNWKLRVCEIPNWGVDDDTVDSLITSLRDLSKDRSGNLNNHVYSILVSKKQWNKMSGTSAYGAIVAKGYTVVVTD